jgi:ribosomal protein S18 acetylase RimI-like enzyme
MTNNKIENMENVRLVPCDFTVGEQREAYMTLLCRYMVNPMGGMDHGLDADQQQTLADQLMSNPQCRCFLLSVDGTYVGLATCFFITSTFKVKPYLYIHDLYVDESREDKGLGTHLLEGLVSYARQAGCCKVTLEVRSDNDRAMHVYQKLGFVDCQPPMYFWTKTL